MPTKYNIPDHYKGDTFNGLQFTIKDTVTLNAIDLTGAAIKIQFRKGNKRGLLEKEFVISDGITLSNALGGIFQIDTFVLDWDVASYYYDIEMTFVSGVVVTYIEGIINITQDVTYG